MKGRVDSKNKTGALPPTAISITPDSNISPRQTSQARPVDECLVITMYKKGDMQETPAPSA